MKKTARTFAALALTFSSLSNAFAEDSFNSEFVRRFPFGQGALIQPAFKGFHSVVKGQEVFFVADDFSVLIKGDVTDLTTGRNLTKKLSYKAMPKIPPEGLMKFDARNAIQYGNGSKVIYVFSDPDCPYCRQFQAEIPKLKDTTVFVFPYPLSELHPAAADAATAIWCSPDKAKAWDAYLTKRIQPAGAGKCMTPMATNKAIAEKFGIMGTPTIILADGRMFPFMISAADINEETQGIK
jgi:thiol:disulfide interchange protein DsbC